MKTHRNYYSALVELIEPMINLLRVRQLTHETTGDRFIYLIESNVTTVWRWDDADGFIFCGETC